MLNTGGQLQMQTYFGQVFMLQFISYDSHSGIYKLVLRTQIIFKQPMTKFELQSLSTCLVNYIHQNANCAQQIIACKFTFIRLSYSLFVLTLSFG